MKWDKKDLMPDQVKAITARVGCDNLVASILVRRGIIHGADLLYYLEDSLRFQHNPFLFDTMEDAVDRIWQAVDEEEKVLVFGDRDVDGITSTVLLVDALRRFGVKDVTWRLPKGDEDYGLTTNVIDEFAADYGTLLIAVDCGISNTPEAAYAAEKGIDLIVIDHHEPPQSLPEAIIIDPKVPGCLYPFVGVSACALAYKTASALRFSQTPWYKQEVCLLNVRPVKDAYVIECIKTVNLTEKERLCETIVPGIVTLQQTRLLPFLAGQQIITWDAPLQKKQLETIFGKAYDFQLLDLRDKAASFFPSVAAMSLLKLKSSSRVARYCDTPQDEIDGFFNFFVTYVERENTGSVGGAGQQETYDLELVALAAIADIMPLVDENRLFVRAAVAAFNKGIFRPGLLELFSRIGIKGVPIAGTDLAWKITPVLNAPGRFGKPELVASILFSEDPAEQDRLTREIIEYNEKRKNLETSLLPLAEAVARKNLALYNDKFAVVIDEKVHRGVTGLLANALLRTFGVPAVVTAPIEGDKVVGSVRSGSSLDAFAFLTRFQSILLHFGGHRAAAGFSMEHKNLPAFSKALAEYALIMEDSPPEEAVLTIDAELPHAFMMPSLIKTVDRLDPYGTDFQDLCFLVRKAKIVGALVVGKGERTHLKLTFQFGGDPKIPKWPAMYWGASARYKRDFTDGDLVDVVFSVVRNIFQGLETIEMRIIDMEKSS